MATKTATVFIVDVGTSMGDCHNGRSITDLEYGLQYVWDKMATIMAQGRKGDNIGVIGLRTDETDNPLSESEDGYENLSIVKELGPMEVGNLQHLQKTLVPSNTEEGDALSAVALAAEQIEKFTTLKSGKPGIFVRTIILLTDGEGVMSDEDVGGIAERLNELKIALTVV